MQNDKHGQPGVSEVVRHKRCSKPGHTHLLEIIPCRVTGAAMLQPASLPDQPRCPGPCTASEPSLTTNCDRVFRLLPLLFRPFLAVSHLLHALGWWGACFKIRRVEHARVQAVRMCPLASAGRGKMVALMRSRGWGGNRTMRLRGGRTPTKGTAHSRSPPRTCTPTLTGLVLHSRWGPFPATSLASSLAALFCHSSFALFCPFPCRLVLPLPFCLVLPLPFCLV